MARISSYTTSMRTVTPWPKATPCGTLPASSCKTPNAGKRSGKRTHIWITRAFIYPGDILRIGLVGGNPRILVQRGDRSEVRLGPEIRVLPLVSAVPKIPLEDIENSFTQDRIVDPAMIDAAPYIVKNLGNNLLIGTGDEVYARGL